jgi:hypothetical protein
MEVVTKTTKHVHLVYRFRAEVRSRHLQSTNEKHYGLEKLARLVGRLESRRKREDGMRKQENMKPYEKNKKGWKRDRKKQKKRKDKNERRRRENLKKWRSVHVCNTAQHSEGARVQHSAAQ